MTASGLDVYAEFGSMHVKTCSESLVVQILYFLSLEGLGSKSLMMKASKCCCVPLKKYFPRTNNLCSLFWWI